jgi:hypothetical protein
MLGPVQLGAQRAEHPVPVPAVGDGAAELGPYAAHQVAERAEGARRREVVAIADEHPALGGQVRTDRLDQARLSDAGLAHDQHHGPAPAGGSPNGAGQHRQFGVTLQDPPVHPVILKEQ